MSKSPNVVHINQLEWTEHSHGNRFQMRRKSLGSAAGGDKLGCSLYEVPPGCRAWPNHYHFGNEEAIYVLEGSGTLRLSGEEIALAQGNYIALPVGAEHAHQIINTSNTPLRYLCFSTMIEPDIVVYPDSGKIGVVAGSPPGGAKEKRTLNTLFPADAEIDYWQDEE